MYLLLFSLLLVEDSALLGLLNDLAYQRVKDIDPLVAFLRIAHVYHVALATNEGGDLEHGGVGVTELLLNVKLLSLE